MSFFNFNRKKPEPKKDDTPLYNEHGKLLIDSISFCCNVDSKTATMIYNALIHPDKDEGIHICQLVDKVSVSKYGLEKAKEIHSSIHELLSQSPAFNKNQIARYDSYFYDNIA